jgi:hypothetical protein
MYVPQFDHKPREALYDYSNSKYVMYDHKGNLNRYQRSNRSIITGHFSSKPNGGVIDRGGHSVISDWFFRVFRNSDFKNSNQNLLLKK